MIRRVLRERHALPEGQPDDFRLMTPRRGAARCRRTARRVCRHLRAAGGDDRRARLSAVVTALLMLVVGEAAPREIGLRRAVGAVARDIATQFAAGDRGDDRRRRPRRRRASASPPRGYVARPSHVEARSTPARRCLRRARARARGRPARGRLPARRAARIEPGRRAAMKAGARAAAVGARARGQPRRATALVLATIGVGVGRGRRDRRARAPAPSARCAQTMETLGTNLMVVRPGAGAAPGEPARDWPAA